MKALLAGVSALFLGVVFVLYVILDVLDDHHTATALVLTTAVWSGYLASVGQYGWAMLLVLVVVFYLTLLYISLYVGEVDEEYRLE